MNLIGIFIRLVFVVVVGLLILFFYSCSFERERDSKSGIDFKKGKDIVGKISNTFGSSLDIDIDGDGSKDSAIVLKNIGVNRVAPSMCVDDKGNVFIAWYSEGVWVLKFDNNGNLGKSFGADGKIVIKDDILSGSGIVRDIYVDKAGNIFITGYVSSSLSCVFVVKLSSNGSLDAIFGDNGKVFLDANGILETNLRIKSIVAFNSRNSREDKSKKDKSISYYSTKVSSLCLDNEGNIFLGGCSYKEGGSDVFIWKLDSKGRLSSDFGNNGIVILRDLISDFSGYEVNSLCLDKEGNIFIGGFSWYRNFNNCKVFILKLNSNGNLDSGFGSGGKVILSNIVSSNKGEKVLGMYLDNRMNILLGGYSYNRNKKDGFLVKIDDKGRIVSEFGINGKLIFHNLIGYSFRVDKYGNIFVGGKMDNYGRYGAFVIKLDSSGKFDSTFGKGGKIVLSNIKEWKIISVNDVCIDNKGNIFILGTYKKDNIFFKPQVNILVFKIE